MIGVAGTRSQEASHACTDRQTHSLATRPHETSGQVMGIPPPPCLGARALCLRYLEPLPWRPPARFRPLAGAASLGGSAAASGGGAALLDRLPPAAQRPGLARSIRRRANWKHGAK